MTRPALPALLLLACAACSLSASEPTWTDDAAWANWKVPPNQPSAYTTDADTATDQVTGLVWQRAPVATASSWAGAAEACAGLQLGGRAWSLPTRIELFSLVRFGDSPAIDDAFELPAGDLVYWTSSVRRPESKGQSWTVNFGTGVLNGDSPSAEHRVRCVSRETRTVLARYTLLDEVAIDTQTGLMWKRAVLPSYFTYAKASAHCASLQLEGGGWRLPTVRELATLVNEFVSEDAPIDAVAFPETPNDGFWSSTPDSDGRVWVVYFDYGETGTVDSDDGLYVRCVKSD